MGRSGSRIVFHGYTGLHFRARLYPLARLESRLAMLNVLVTMPFSEAQLDRMRRVSPSLTVTREDPDAADYARADVLYAGMPPRDLGQVRTSSGCSCTWPA